MKQIRIYFTLVFLVACFSSCAKDTNETNDTESLSGLDYTNSTLWYELETEAVQDVDVFYILPTCIWDWQNENGDICHYADVNSAEQRADMEGSYALAREIFASESNFYAPYYRQISLESWIEGDSVVEARFPFALADLEDAFDYFINNLNDNRPFIIAGFSQGGKGVVELLKGMSEQVFDRMIVAYVIGYRVTDEDLLNSNVVAAQSADDISVTICYNSVERAESICPVLSPSAICINPVNWRVDAQAAELMEGVTVEVDTENNVLLVSGLDSQLYYLSILSDLFALGNYHLQELNFYQQSLKENVATRIEAFNNL